MTNPVRPALRNLAFAIRRRLRRPVAGRFQPYPHTLPDRYPWLFDFAAGALAGVPAPRLLSFGCSKGDEVFSLRQRFPRAVIKGIDINPACIATCIARSRALNDARLIFAAATNTEDEPAGHYHAIFCLSVLCHGDLAVSRAPHSGRHMRFADFERCVEGFAHCLAPGGLLFLHTTNFRFCDTATAAGFDIVLEARPDQMAADPLYDPLGRLLAGERYYQVGFRKQIAAP